MDKNSPDILDRLSRFAKDECICIMHACESGSWWGFASPGIYNVRFVYMHSPLWYLSISEQIDIVGPVIKGNVNFLGWDIRKTLLHFMKSNPVVLEWLQAGSVYLDNDGFIDDLRKLMPEYYSPRRCLSHYYSMAQSQYLAYFNTNSDCRIKYLYIIKSLLACRWIESSNVPAPPEFSKLMEATVLDSTIINMITDLLVYKNNGQKKDQDKAGVIPQLETFIEAELMRIKPVNYSEAKSIDIEPLNQLLRKYLEQPGRV